MKIGLYADAHVSMSASIVMGSSGTLTGRLEKIIQSFKFMYHYFEQQGVDLIVNLGDLTDAPHLRAEEITALSLALSHNKKIEEIHILGNHESLTEDGLVNSVSFLKNLIVSPEVRKIGGRDILFLPYRKYAEEDIDKYNADIVLGHLEIKGSQASSSYFLQTGISPEFLSKKFGLTISGHTHKHSYIKKNVLNLGSLSGLNFSSDGDKHYIGVLDVEKKDIKLLENPHALQFKKIEISSLGELNRALVSLNTPENFAIQVKCPYDMREDTRKMIEQHKIGYSKIISKLEKEGMSIPMAEQEKIEKVNTVDDGFKLLLSFLEEKSKSKDFSTKDFKTVIDGILENKESI